MGYVQFDNYFDDYFTLNWFVKYMIFIISYIIKVIYIVVQKNTIFVLNYVVYFPLVVFILTLNYYSYNINNSIIVWSVSINWTYLIW